MSSNPEQKQITEDVQNEEGQLKDIIGEYVPALQNVNIEKIINNLPSIQYYGDAIERLIELYATELKFQFIQYSVMTGCEQYAQIKVSEDRLITILPALYRDHLNALSLDVKTLGQLLTNIILDGIKEVKILFPFHVPGHWLAVEILVNIEKKECSVLGHNNLGGFTFNGKEKTEIKQFISSKFKIEEDKTLFKESPYKNICRSSSQNCGVATILDIINLAEGKKLEAVCNTKEGGITTRVAHLNKLGENNDGYYIKDLLPKIKKSKSGICTTITEEDFSTLDLFCYIAFFPVLGIVLSAITLDKKENVALAILCISLITLSTAGLTLIFFHEPEGTIEVKEVTQQQQKELTS